MKKIKLVLLPILLSLLMISLNQSMAESQPSSYGQIISHGQTRYYDSGGKEIIVAPVLGSNCLVAVEKGISATESENEFIMTLSVKTPVDISALKLSSDAAVVLVLDISNSTNGLNRFGNHNVADLLAAAQSFVETFASQANKGTRYISLVVYGANAIIVRDWVDVTNETIREMFTDSIYDSVINDSRFMQGGLQLARNLLRKDALPKGKNGSPIENRSVIIFSDGAAKGYHSKLGEAGFLLGHALDSSIVSGTNIDEASKIAAELMADTVQNQLGFASYAKYSANLYTIAYGSAAPQQWLQEKIATDPSYAWAAHDAASLEEAFASIGRSIESGAQVWIVKDVLGANIEFIGSPGAYDISSGLLRLEDNTLCWDLKKAEPDSFAHGIYTYTYKYRIRLDTASSAFVPAISYPTSGVSELVYVANADLASISSPLKADFTVPAVMGYNGVRTVHGFVRPLASLDLGIAGFMEQHAVTVELRSSFAAAAPPELSTQAVLSDSSGLGEFRLMNVPVGSYILHISRPGYLVRSMSVTVLADAPDVVELAPPGLADEGVFNLYGGDCNNDFTIDTKDQMMVMELMSFGVDHLDPLYDPACDINADGLIDGQDVALIIEMLGNDIWSYPGAEDIDPSR